MTRNSLPTPTDQDHYIRNLSADLIDNHGSKFCGFLRLGDNYYHGLSALAFDPRVALSLLAVSRELNDNLTQHLLAKHLAAMVTVENYPDILHNSVTADAESNSNSATPHRSPIRG